MALHDMTQKEAAQKAIALIMDAVNIMGSDKPIVEGITDEIRHSHRTLQQNFWRVMVQVIKEYSNNDSDLRNEGAVQFCKEVTKFLEENPNKEYLPYI